MPAPSCAAPIPASSSARTCCSTAEPSIQQWAEEPSHGGDSVRGRADRARQPQRRGRQQETRAAMGAEPVGELGEVPDFAKIDTELEQAMGVQWQRGAVVFAFARAR